MKFILFLLFSFSAIANSAQNYWITIGSDAITHMKKTFGHNQKVEIHEKIAITQIKEEHLPVLTHIMHENLHRCGGYQVHDSYDEALQTTFDSLADSSNFLSGLINYTINQENKVKNAVDQVTEKNIESTIRKLSSFHNRFYKSQSGIDSSEWILQNWKNITALRTDISVAKYQHRRWPQPSIIASIKGAKYPDEVIILGGHADSIAGMWGGEHAKAPGADDNASGIATITEVLRILVDTGFQPERTIQFMAYAAEEVGLLGSKEIAAEYKAKSVNVLGVAQFDMTNFNGSSQYDIVFMTDFTNKDQNEFMGKLIDTYVKVPWGYSKCGYGCSDHASWHQNGFPASIPFEASKNDMNRKIHTANDTIAVSGDDASHAAKFAKLGVAFAIEMAKSVQ